MTRKEVQRWFAPLRKVLVQMLTGEVDEIDGKAVVELSPSSYARIDWLIEGWINCLRYVSPKEETDALALIHKKLVADEQFTTDDIASALRRVSQFETLMLKIPYEHIKSASSTAQISVHLEKLREAA